MSLVRLIIWSSLIGGWAAFLSWLVLEVLIGGRWVREYDFVAFIMATLIAIPIGGAICMASGLTNPRLENLLKRLAFGCAGGLLGGVLGVMFGFCLFSGVNKVNASLNWTIIDFLGRIVGWTLIGVGIGAGVGAGEGIFDRSFKKFRNGLLGGVLGGFLGGLFFGILALAGGSITNRAFSFVLLGLAIGLFIGLAQVILKEAWLTVEAGFRPGRQMILGSDLVTMGTSEKSSLIFIAYGAKGVEPTHLKISKQGDGRFVLEDNQSRTGTMLNGTPIRGATLLNDGDAIQFGVNVVRFNERVKHCSAEKLPPPVVAKDVPKAAAPVTAKAVVAPTPAVPAAKAAPAKPAPPPKPQEGRCPICDKAVVGMPGQRRCNQCFTTF